MEPIRTVTILSSLSFEFSNRETSFLTPYIEDWKEGRQISEMRRIAKPPNLIGKMD
jgi:hypothetical protein